MAGGDISGITPTTYSATGSTQLSSTDENGKTISSDTQWTEGYGGNAASAASASGSNVQSKSTKQKIQAEIDRRVAKLKTKNGMRSEYTIEENICFRKAVNNKYKAIVKETNRNLLERGLDSAIAIRDFQEEKIFVTAAEIVYAEDLEWAKATLTACIRRSYAEEDDGESKPTISTDESTRINDSGYGPFDRRIYRDFVTTDNEKTVKIPFNTRFAESATSGLIAGKKFMEESNLKEKTQAIKDTLAERESLKNDNFFIGVPALINTYALTKLYGSQGGAYLVNRRDQRKWYEVDTAFGPGANNLVGFSKNPTTSTLINWGNGDPYGRTPYHFTDFAFSKYWNKIENNRLITLRRYPAPIVDNLKFPGMDGVVDTGNSDNTGGGSSSKVLFPPMASAITYLGDETGNNINELLKFTTGVKWDEAKSDVWEVRAESTPDSESGPSGIFKGLGKLSKMLAVAGGNFDPELLMNNGALPPDPYSEGPYENRIKGPVNRIDAVKKRAAGLEFDWSGLNLTFEYVARPIGGINPKAVLLDILSNFLVIGSASAVFFGGQHRFMANPAKYPFLGGDKGIEQWYSGKPIEYAGTAIDSFVNQVSDPKGGIATGAGDFFNQLLGKSGEGGIKGIFGAVKGLFTGDGIGANIVKSKLAEKSAGQVPYLSGLKALLTGEPVGEWHVTIGNPLNPIAMIGNLICTGIEVEFGNELGPDDFPTELKIIAKLDHGMARDRDAIQSVFNRGMGRIYDLPDGFEGSADGVTAVDDNTKDVDEAGTPLAIKGWFAGPSTTGGKSGTPVIKELSVGDNPTIWPHAPFKSVSPNDKLIGADGEIGRSAYRALDWVALKSLKA